MGRLAKVLLILQGLLYISEGKASTYELDILEVQWNTTTPDLVEINLKPVQPTRGVFGVSGTIDFKEDIDMDETIAQVKVYYSSTGITYQLSPFRIPEQTFATALNGPYKQYLMEAMTECCENAPEGDTFTTPFEQRLIKCENCIFPSENFPPGLRLGYYRLVIMLSKNVDFNISLLLKIDLP